MMIDCQVRLANSTDAANIAALSIQVWLDTYATSGIRDEFSKYVLMEFTEAKMTEVIERKESIILVAEVDRHLIGYVHATVGQRTAFTLEEHQAEIDRLYVQNRFAHAGVGTALMREIEKLLVKAGVEAMWLSVWVENERALRFYAKIGFVDKGLWRFLLGDSEYDDRIFVKMIS